MVPPPEASQNQACQFLHTLKVYPLWYTVQRRGGGFPHPSLLG